MNASRSASGSGESSSRTSPTASARRTLRRISWRSFLPSVGEVVVDVGADRQGHDRADVLALDVERPALGDLARPEGRGQRVGGRVAAAQPAEVDDVPRSALGGLGEVGRRARRRRPAGRPGRPGASRSRRGTRRRRRPPSRSAGPASARRRAPWRIVVWVSASPGSTSWRCMSGTIATGSAPAGASAGDEDQRLLVRVRAVGVPPRALEGPAGERGRPRVAGGEGVPGRRAGCRRSSGARRAAARPATGRSSRAVGRRTGRLRVKGQGGHAETVHRVRFRCAGNVSSAGSTMSR